MDATGSRAVEMRLARGRLARAAGGLRKEKARVALTVEEGVEQAGLPLLQLKSAADWASAGVRDAPDLYMQRLVDDILAPACQTIAHGPPRLPPLDLALLHVSSLCFRSGSCRVCARA